MTQITKQDVMIALTYLFYYTVSLLITMLAWGQLHDSGIIDLDVFIEFPAGVWIVFISVAVAPTILALVLTQITVMKGGKDAQPEE